MTVPKLKKAPKEAKETKEPAKPKVKGRPANKIQYPTCDSDNEFSMEESKKPVFIPKGKDAPPLEEQHPQVTFEQQPQLIYNHPQPSAALDILKSFGF